MASPWAKTPDQRKRIGKSMQKYYQSPAARKKTGERKMREAIERLAMLDPEAVTHKRCTKCKILKPIEDFSIRRDKLKSGLVHVRPESNCRKCCAERAKQNKERRIAEGKEDQAGRSRRYRENLSPQKKAERRRKDRERQAIRRREEGIPPRNFKRRLTESRTVRDVPVEPISPLIEVLESQGWSRREISIVSGVNERRLYDIRHHHSPSVSIDNVDRLLIAFEMQDAFEELYPLESPPRERLVGYNVEDPKGILKRLSEG